MSSKPYRKVTGLKDGLKRCGKYPCSSAATGAEAGKDIRELSKLGKQLQNGTCLVLEDLRMRCKEGRRRGCQTRFCKDLVGLGAAQSLCWISHIFCHLEV